MFQEYSADTCREILPTRYRQCLTNRRLKKRLKFNLPLRPSIIELIVQIHENQQRLYDILIFKTRKIKNIDRP